MVLHVPLPYDHGRDSALGVRGPCPRAGGLGGPSPPPGKQGGVGGCKPPTCYRVKVLHGTQPCIPIIERAIERSIERPSDRATARPKMIITRAPDVHLRR